MSQVRQHRDLAGDERRLILKMIEQGAPEAGQFLPPLGRHQVHPTRGPCGWAGIDFSIAGPPQTSGPLHRIADFLVAAILTAAASVCSCRRGTAFRSGG